MRKINMLNKVLVRKKWLLFLEKSREKKIGVKMKGRLISKDWDDLWWWAADAWMGRGADGLRNKDNLFGWVFSFSLVVASYLKWAQYNK
ncbi:hypothetical protein LINPERHAP1_LOCUS41720 [Linum perenne]